MTAGIFCAVKAIQRKKVNAKTWREVEVEKSVLARAWESPYLAHDIGDAGAAGAAAGSLPGVQE